MKFSSARNTGILFAVGLQVVVLGCRPASHFTQSERGDVVIHEAANASQKGGDLAAETKGETTKVDSGRGADVTAQTDPKASNLACGILDPAKSNSVVIPGGPAGLAIPVTKYVKTPGMIKYSSPSVATFKFSAFRRAGTEWTLEWPSGYTNYYIHNFEATVTGADTEKCVITARQVSAPEQRTMHGCFDPATKVRMADSKDRRIDSLRIGDLVLNPVTGKAAPVVRITKGPEAGKGLYLIGFKGVGSATAVKVTGKHPFMTEHGLRTASQLAKGDRVLTAKGTFRKLDIASALPEKTGQVVVNIVVGSPGFEARDHMVLADGVVSGDLMLQERLENLTGISLNKTDGLDTKVK